MGTIPALSIRPSAPNIRAVTVLAPVILHVGDRACQAPRYEPCTFVAHVCFVTYPSRKDPENRSRAVRRCATYVFGSTEGVTSIIRRACKRFVQQKRQ